MNERGISAVTALSISVSDCWNCSSVIVAGSKPSLSAARPTVSRISVRYVTLPLFAGSQRTARLASSPVADLS